MLQMNELLQAASARSGLQDYGDPRFTQGLEVLVQAVNAEAGLAAEHAARFREYLLRILVNRLRMQRDLRHHPEILDEVLLPPVFITSLPRTGSTKLHRMLAASGRFNNMTFWQVYNFAPFAGRVPASEDPRIADAEEYLTWMRARSPLLMLEHPMYALETEEESLLLDVNFNHAFSYAILLNVPSYVGWVMAQDPVQVFEDLRGILQYMQWQHHPGRQRRWLLKTPALLGMEPLFAHVFPGADFIVPHRHPMQIVASCCSLFSGFRDLFNEGVAPEVAGAAIVGTFGQGIDAHLRWRRQYPAEKILDLRFKEIVTDEAAVAHQVHDWLGLPFEQAESEALQNWRLLDAARRHESARLPLSHYGLEEQAVGAVFADYIQRCSAWF